MSRLLQGLLCLWLTAAAVSHAALFDDKEARKRILEVETKSLANDEAQVKAHEQLKQSVEKRLSALENLSQGLIELQNQIEALKQEIAQLKGDNELLTHKLEEAQLRQKELYADTDTRLKRFESGNATGTHTNNEVPKASSNASLSEDEAKSFADAEAYAQASKYKEAFNAYDVFLKAYPNSEKAPDAMYGMGYAQFALKNYKSSMATQQKLLDGHPEHAKVPEAMYNMANSQIQLGQITNAKKTLKALIEKHPQAEVIPNAQKRLKALEALK